MIPMQKYQFLFPRDDENSVTKLIDLGCDKEAIPQSNRSSVQFIVTDWVTPPIVSYRVPSFRCSSCSTNDTKNCQCYTPEHHSSSQIKWASVFHVLAQWKYNNQVNSRRNPSYWKCSFQPKINISFLPISFKRKCKTLIEINPWIWNCDSEPRIHPLKTLAFKTKQNTGYV